MGIYEIKLQDFIYEIKLQDLKCDHFRTSPNLWGVGGGKAQSPCLLTLPPNAIALRL